MYAYLTLWLLVPLLSHAKAGDPEFSEYVLDCDPRVDSQCESLTLHQIARNLTKSDVIIDISMSQLQLVEIVKFHDLESVRISGINTTISCTSENSGLVFSNISRLTIDSITLANCGAQVETYGATAALSFLHCKDVNASNLQVSKSKGIGLMIMDHQGGTIQISSSNFTENVASVHHDLQCGEMQSGGGVYVGGFRKELSSSALYSFHNCLFAKNVASTNFSLLTNVNELRPLQGGGVSLVSDNGVTNNIEAVFTQCTFLENYAVVGGGLLVEIESGRDMKSRGNISIIVQDSSFEANGCGLTKSAYSGGGATFNLDAFNKPNFTSNSVILQRVNFSRNCAELGGGIYFSSGHEDHLSKDLSSFIIESCTFSDNRGYVGSAIGMMPSIFDASLHTLLLTPTFKNCKFLSNIPSEEGSPQVSHSRGIIYSNLYNIKFEEQNDFRDNYETALYIVNGQVDFMKSSAVFVNNTGLEGGAMALIGLSSFKVGGSNSYTFENNTAISRGGAIFSFAIDSHDYAMSRNCFIRNNGHFQENAGILLEYKWNTTIIFTGNRANGGTGHAIFATSLHSCQLVGSPTSSDHVYSPVDIADVFTVRGMRFDDDPALQPQIATEGAILYYNSSNKVLELKVVPGELIKHGVALSDDLNNTVQLTLRASVKDNLAVELDSAFSSCLSDEIALKGMPGQEASLLLQTLPPRQTSLELQVKLLDCPPGFIVADNECICDPRPYIGLRCDANKFYSFISPGFWAGLVTHENGTVLATGTAPTGFCDYNGTQEESLGVRLPRNISQLDEAVCGKSRTGVLCGDCRPGYTTYFHSPNFRCKPADPTMCQVGWLFYVLSEIVPITIMFITVLALNISFTSGAINGFIFFAQLLDTLNVDAFGIITYPTAISILAQVYQVIYGFFNLDFFNIDALSFCIWSNATALDMLAFKYITIVYALLLVVSVVVLTHRCGGRYLGKCCRITKLKTSVIHGISTFLVICYAQCVKVSLTLLQGYTYALQRGNRMNVPTIVFLNANLPYFTGRHLIYALPALFFLLTLGIVPPLLLLAYPLLNKILALCGIEDSKLVNCVSKFLPIGSLKPLLDSFQGCFKDNLRFFAGLYFIYRWIPFIVDASTYSNSTFYLTVEILLVSILTLHAVCQPYLTRTHNIVDILLLFNLAIITAISFGNYYRSRNYGQRRQSDTDAWSAVQLVLIYLPAFALTIYVVISGCSCLSKEWWKKQNSDQGKRSKLKSIVRHFSSSDIEKPNEEELPHRLTSPSEYDDRGAALREPFLSS